MSISCFFAEKKMGREGAQGLPARTARANCHETHFAYDCLPANAIYLILYVSFIVIEAFFSFELVLKVPPHEYSSFEFCPVI